jgi:predicted DCC family thiol-disulfide oxidoreductase YuxK
MSSATPQVSGRHLILYDGVCGLCNRLNAFVLPRDPQGKFHFAPLQSEVSHEILRRYGRDPGELNTFYIVSDYGSDSSRLLSKTDAALFVARQIGGLWRLATILSVVPASLRNVFYDLIARYRYRIFGRHDSCPIPRAEHKSRFIGL